MELQQFVKEIHTGTLDVNEVGRGMHKCFSNAKSLINDAEDLLQHRPGCAISLTVLAFEEIAKVYILYNAAVQAEMGETSWDKVEKALDLRSHLSKLEAFASYGNFLLKKTYENFFESELPTGFVPLLDKFKQLGLYVNFVHGRFYSPDEFGNENREWAIWLIEVAKERLDKIQHMHETEEASIEIAQRSAKLADLAKDARSEEELAESIKLWLKSSGKT